MATLGADWPVSARRGLGIAGLVFAVGLLIWLSAAAVALADSAEEAAGCDPIDTSACLMPWPNDYFTVADAGTATGKRLN